MSKPIIGSRMRRILAQMTPIRPPKTEAEFQALLHGAGIHEPRPGRPRKGTSARSSVLHLRLSDDAIARLKRIAAQRHSTVSKVARRSLLELSLTG